MRIVLAMEVAAARLVGRTSRLLGRGGGTTLPGKLLWKVDPGAVTRLSEHLPGGAVVVSATNGKTTTTAMLAGLLGPDHKLAWNRSGANLASGVTSTLLDARDADLALLEVDEFALAALLPRIAPRVLLLGNLFRDQLDRYGELEHIAERWRTSVAALPSSTRIVVNADDPLVASLAEDRSGVVRYGLDDRRVARPALQHAADSKYCVACGSPYRYTAAYIGHLGEYACPTCGHSRPRLDVSARQVTLDGLDRSRFELVTPGGSAHVDLPLPGLYNIYNALGAAAAGVALGLEPPTIAERLAHTRAAFGRFERIASGDRGILMLLIKNPAGANEAVRTLVDGGVPSTVMIALNDAIADGRDVSWIWDVDFEPLLAHAERLIVSGARAAELALRFTYAGFPRDRLDVVDDLEQALDKGLALTTAGEELAVLPTYTAMLALRAIVANRGLVRPFWEPQESTA